MVNSENSIDSNAYKNYQNTMIVGVSLRSGYY